MKITDMVPQRAATEPKPTENAQIMFQYSCSASPTIYRYNDAKKGRKAYEAVVKAWKAHDAWCHQMSGKPRPDVFFELKADMFDGHIDLSHIVSINFVEWPKRGKFVPRIL